jgi:Domain of unknown function (DUF4062)
MTRAEDAADRSMTSVQLGPPLFDRQSAPGRQNDAKKYQIFVSSTFTDLVDERRAVTEVILSMGHIPVGMELFEAGNEDQWSYIKNRILEVDYYLLIMAERYGSLGPEGISYTEMEYRYAIEQEVPVAALLLDSARRDQWPAGKIDFEHREKLNSFRKLCQDRIVAYWSDSGTLTTRCQLALSGLFRRHPQSGWVSGDQAVSPQLASELARLSSENADLRSQLARFQQQGAADKELDAAVGRLIEPFKKLAERSTGRFPHFMQMLQDPPAVKMLDACSLFGLLMYNPGNYLDGASVDTTSDNLKSYVERKINEIDPNLLAENSTNEEAAQAYRKMVILPLIGAVGLMMRSWGLFESFLADRPQKPPEKWLRLSSLGRRAFNEALGQFLDGKDAAPRDAGPEGHAPAK